MKNKLVQKTKRLLSGIVATVIAASMLPTFPVMAEETQEIYTCVLFAQGTEDSIRLSAQSVSMNGDIVTNGSFTTICDYESINGTAYENQENFMIDYHSTIEELYFYDDVNYIDYSYIPTTYNENINVSTFVEGEFNSCSNVAVNNTALMTVDNVTVQADSFNSTNSVIYSQLGDIHIESDNFSASGLIYAPFGKVYIESNSINISGSIIAQEIEIVGNYNVNINKNESFMENMGVGVTTPINYEEDDDIIDIGEAYFKDITSEEDIAYAGNGIYCVKNQLLLTADNTVGFSEVALLANEYNATIVGYIELTNDYQLEFNEDIDVETIKGIINEIKLHSFIESASLNIISTEDEEFFSNDTEWNSNWNETTPSGTNWGIETIKLESALINLGVIASSSSTSNNVDTSMLYNVKIGLIDAGFDVNHEDLNFTQTLNNYSSITGLSDETDHGTHTSGTMGAGFNNNTGITGICIKNRLYGYSTSGNTNANISNKSSIFKNKFALAWLIGNNVKVINHSMGNGDMAFCAAQGNINAMTFQSTTTVEYDKFLCKLIDKGYDFLIVTSAGNSNSTSYYEDLNTTEAPYGYVSVSEYNRNPANYPNADTSTTYGASTSSATVILNDTDAKYDDAFQYSTNYKIRSRVVSVGSLSLSKSISDFSCRGSRVDVLAPGESIRSTVTTGNGLSGGNYTDMSGTSMAAPHASGTLGLAFSINPAISASRLKSTLISTGSNYGLTIGTKNINVVNAAETISKTKDILQSLTTSGNNISSNEYNGIAMGFVQDERGEALPDVRVTATLESSNGLSTDNQIIKSVTTDEEGEYEIILPAGRYRLQFEKLLYLGETVYYEAVQEEIKYIDTVTLFDESWTDSIFQTVYGQVSDAMNGLGVSDAQVKFRNGWNNTSGEYISNLFGDKTTTTDNNGNYSMGLSVGAYTAEISKDGYITAYVNIVSSPNTSVHFSTITPVLADNEYRIILTWGDTPRDLDSHLSGMVNGNSYHVYYGNKSYSYDGITIASLDWDDTSSYGPETITLTWTENNGNCSYYVYDFTNRGNSNSTALSYSSAKVVVYKGNTLLNTYNVPIGFSGTTWNVFSINNGDLTTINTIS